MCGGVLRHANRTRLPKLSVLPHPSCVRVASGGSCAAVFCGHCREVTVDAAARQESERRIERLRRPLHEPFGIFALALALLPVSPHHKCLSCRGGACTVTGSILPKEREILSSLRRFIVGQVTDTEFAESFDDMWVMECSPSTRRLSDDDNGDHHDRNYNFCRFEMQDCRTGWIESQLGRPVCLPSLFLPIPIPIPFPIIPLLLVHRFFGILAGPCRSQSQSQSLDFLLSFFPSFLLFSFFSSSEPLSRR